MIEQATAPVAFALNEALKGLSPSYVDIVNESMSHAGYFDGKESHFKLTIVSPDFANKRLVARHQMIYQAAAPLLTAQGGSIHALAIHAFSPDEWQHQDIPSPNCAGKNV